MWRSRHSLGMREADSRGVELPILTPWNPQAYTDPRACFPLLRLLPRTSQGVLHTLSHRYKKSKQMKYYIGKHMHNESMTLPSHSPPPLRITVSLCIIDGFYFSVSFFGGVLINRHSPTSFPALPTRQNYSTYPETCFSKLR